MPAKAPRQPSSPAPRLRILLQREAFATRRRPPSLSGLPSRPRSRPAAERGCAANENGRGAARGQSRCRGPCRAPSPLPAQPRPLLPRAAIPAQPPSPHSPSRVFPVPAERPFPHSPAPCTAPATAPAQPRALRPGPAQPRAGSYLTAFAGEQPVVVPGDLVPADRTELVQVLIVGIVHPLQRPCCGTSQRVSGTGTGTGTATPSPCAGLRSGSAVRRRPSGRCRSRSPL